jgi:hypothetical protein
MSSEVHSIRDWSRSTREGVVAKRTLWEYQSNSLENHRKFDSWLKANASLGFILFLGILGMALAGLLQDGTTEIVSSATALR